METLNDKTFKIIKIVIYTLIIIISTLLVDNILINNRSRHIKIDATSTDTAPELFTDMTSERDLDKKDESGKATITIFQTSYIEYTVEEGDNFWDLADKFYDDPQKYTLIIAENGESIYPGEVIKIPEFKENSAIFLEGDEVA